MNNNSEHIYTQLVLSELAGMVQEEKAIRVSFSPGSDTHRSLTTLARQRGVSERDIIEAAVRVFFVAFMRSNNA